MGNKIIPCLGAGGKNCCINPNDPAFCDAKTFEKRRKSNVLKNSGLPVSSQEYNDLRATL